MKILVLGVGNILYQDEGIGVRVVQELEKSYLFSDNVRLMDGGTLGLRLLDVMMEYERMIVIDAALWGAAPGRARTFSAEETRLAGRSFQKTIHQMDLPDTLALCEKLGQAPQTVVIGVQPHNCLDLGDRLTPPLLAALDEIIALTLKLIKEAGGTWQIKTGQD